MSYQATIFFSAAQDIYNDGESMQIDNEWREVLRADSLEQLRAMVLEITYSKWEDLDDTQINGYKHATEYHTTYMANADNIGSATPPEIADWKRGRTRLWAINCHILVSEIIERKVKL